MSKHPPFEFLEVEGLDFSEVQVPATACVAVPSACVLAPLDLLLIQITCKFHAHIIIITYNDFINYTSILKNYRSKTYPRKSYKISSTVITGPLFSINKYCPFKSIQLWYKTVIISQHLKTSFINNFYIMNIQQYTFTLDFTYASRKLNF